MHSGEKEGGSLRPVRQMANFCEVINSCQLRGLGYISQDFTWSRCLGNRGWVRERLDRALVSEDSPSTSRRKRGPKPFRFKTIWLKEESCADVVTTASLKASQKILSPMNHILPNDAKVNALIVLEKKEWNEQLVRQMLGEEEADLVLGIPLSLHLPPD
nr:hypothetical protein CFP56_25023 [Quercus suber]